MVATFTVGYTQYILTTFSIIGDFFSTRRACKIDNDKIYINALKSTDNYIREDKNILLRNGSKVVMKLVYI